MQFLDSQIAKRQKEIGELELHQRSTVHHIELYDAEYRRADAEREVLEVQLRHLEVELERVRQLVASERVKTDKIVRDNRQLQSQLTELIGEFIFLSFKVMKSSSLVREVITFSLLVMISLFFHFYSYIVLIHFFNF